MHVCVSLLSEAAPLQKLRLCPGAQVLEAERMLYEPMDPDKVESSGHGMLSNSGK